MNPKMKKKIKKIISYFLIYIIMIVVCFIFLEPFIEMVTKSFMTQESVIDPEVFYVPTQVTFNNYILAVKVMDYFEALFNSVWFSLLLAILQTLISAFVAYSLARFDFKFKKAWFGLLIFSFIIPLPVLLIPRKMLFQMLSENVGINLFGSIWPQVLVTLLGQGIYSAILILIFFNFFKQIPYDLDEAAYMDGASSIQVLYHVILKLSLPIILTVFLFSFVWNWNETLMSNTFLSSNFKLIPKQLGLFDTIFEANKNSPININEGYQMAGTVLTILPLIILYIFVQKKFIEGIEQTGLTGM